MDISEVARRTGMAASTLRYYEKQGLIAATSPAGQRRRFAPDVLDQLALIALGQAGGLSLDDIRAMLRADGAVQVDRQVLLAKADDIDATIKRLRAMSQGLRHAAQCPAANHAQCPTFQRLLKAAAAGRLKRSTAGLGEPRRNAAGR
ncbi:helix-turn-helix domain-containing protein [Achromobacter sp. UMC71]|uniref:helix-turn-helix domain-containing protein n=1 Tax=Achromobacter sp. UMC71 TaxID=1862320 RepID=UPI0016014139|nr:helix-turn-helix domain-containing protein [Achromobacter sp. UMC71]MBB1623898.1 MerR family transcriptional regulator [Achromobacter sp. UMC71]